MTYKDAISANEIAIDVDPIPASKLPQTSDAGPPLSKLNWIEEPDASHAA
jgi:hypothetical protein